MKITYDFWYLAESKPGELGFAQAFRCRGEGWPHHIKPQDGDILVINLDEESATK